MRTTHAILLVSSIGTASAVTTTARADPLSIAAPPEPLGPARVQRPVDLQPDVQPSSPAFGRAGSILGLRGAMTQARGSDGDDRRFGLTLAAKGEAYASREELTVRSATWFSIGGGTAGFEGSLGGDMAGGMMLPLGRGHGPMTRLGLRGELFGNSLLYTSHLELPQAEIGYQVSRGADHVELGLRAGPMLAGRANLGEHASRKLGESFEWGGHLALHVNPVHLEAMWSRTQARSGPGTPVDLVTASLCGRALRLGVCTDARFVRGDVWTPWGSGESTSEGRGLYVGLLVGLADPRY